MALDGIVIKAVINELKETILFGKIDKIYQPEKDEILINIRSNKNYKLLISASSNNPRIYLTHHTKQNPINPPMFCMLLRKHLHSGKIINIYQPSLERIIVIEIESLDELGIKSVKQLIVEIMGKHSNIILVDKNNNKVIDAIKRISPDISSKRVILPGCKYAQPPSQDKTNPISINEKYFIQSINNANLGELTYKFLYKNYMGISPLIAKEICYRAKIDDSTKIGELNEIKINDLSKEFMYVMDLVRKEIFTPNIIIDTEKNKVVAFSSIDLTQYKNLTKKNFTSISQTLEEFYLTRDKSDRLKQKSSDLRKVINTKLERNITKLAKLKEELLEAKSKDKYKIYGDLITSNIYRIEKGQNEVELENFYSPDYSIVKIKLDPKLTPAQNAQKYYKKYNKLKIAEMTLQEQITKTEEEIKYLENILVCMENSSDIQELEEIRDELIKEGYIKGNNKNNKKSERIISKPYHFISSDGYDIYVGKNNKQNDYLTLKFAEKNDIWLHTKDIPGSHVIIKSNGKNVPEKTILEAALLAAYYSKGKMSSNVPVDYTERKYVKKPKGSKPGMVIYVNNNTLYVTPKIEEINKIKRVE
ncbi:Rqc2 family fibronectin-binding protein [Caloranaerobacter azorensis]|uniref:Rqc2 homolog RqcH n=1 Tax=Caloranaerobacter azorensis TaxID=116090 RepID=A0A6P1YB32_9FIRM|nr:NFACT RNA binding domain-containing protein [Caloranaerobacter azorensis]QIB26267.1 fibronectin/fibrinogen-binding protein [Caloranaerobacter azorensis]